MKLVSPPPKRTSPTLKEVPPKKEVSPPHSAASPPIRGNANPPKQEIRSPPNRDSTSPPKTDVTTQKKETMLSPKKEASPPVSVLKFNRADSKGEENTLPLKTVKKESAFVKETVLKSEKLSLVNNEGADKSLCNTSEQKSNVEDESKNEESNGVGDKIKKFEKVAEDANASANVGRASRAGSVRGRARGEGREDVPPTTTYKDNTHFDISTTPHHGQVERTATAIERQQAKNNSPNLASIKWQRSDSGSSDTEKVKPEPQKIIKPEFKPVPSPVDVTIRSPSLGAKIGDQFPSHGTAFRNVASPDPTRSIHKLNDDVNTQNNFKACKLKNKEKYSVSKGSSYFTRGSEEIWLVKKKDIEEIEERVLDSFRRAGGNVCMRSESMRPSSDSGQGVLSHATMGRNKRQMYARSESLDPQWAGARSQTLKRQTSVACTCGHDKKTRAKSTGSDTPPRPRSRSHGDENNQGHVLDKYETLV